VEPEVAAALVTSIASAGVAIASGAIALTTQKRERDTAVTLQGLKGNTEKEVARLTVELQRQAEKERRELEAEEVLTRYREPLIDAAFELQSRLYNILRKSFLTTYATRRNERREEAIKTTLFRIAQYFGWTENLRRDLQFLKFLETPETKDVVTLQAQVSAIFNTDVGYGSTFMIWKDTQRGIGELMLESEDGSKKCIGYASFLERYDQDFKPWFRTLEEALTQRNTSRNERLVELQHVLLKLVKKLDKEKTRYDYSKLHEA
jgi:hypothetical protein